MQHTSSTPHIQAMTAAELVHTSRGTSNWNGSHRSLPARAAELNDLDHPQIQRHLAAYVLLEASPEFDHRIGGHERGMLGIDVVVPLDPATAHADALHGQTWERLGVTFGRINLATWDEVDALATSFPGWQDTLAALIAEGYAIRAQARVDDLADWDKQHPRRVVLAAGPEDNGYLEGREAGPVGSFTWWDWDGSMFLPQPPERIVGVIAAEPFYDRDEDDEGENPGWRTRVRAPEPGEAQQVATSVAELQRQLDEEHAAQRKPLTEAAAAAARKAQQMNGEGDRADANT